MVDASPNEIPKNIRKLICMADEKFMVEPNSIIHCRYDLGIRLWWLNETDCIVFLNILLNGIEF